MTDDTIVRDNKGRFVSGTKPGPGRRVGSRNRHTENFLSAFADDFERHGASVIEQVRIEKPDVYLRVAAELLPRNLDISVDASSDAASFATNFRAALALLHGEPPMRTIEHEHVGQRR